MHGCFSLSNTSGQSFQPISGGELITSDKTHTPAISISTRSTVRFCAYMIGSVIAQYRSNAIAHKFNMDDVQHNTSHVSHNLHKCMPNIQRPIIILTTLNGNTSTATVKSATASDTMKKFCTIRSGLCVNTLNMTSTLPTIVTTMISVSMSVITNASISGNAKSIPIIDGYRTISGMAHVSVTVRLPNVVKVGVAICKSDESLRFVHSFSSFASSAWFFCCRLLLLLYSPMYNIAIECSI